MRKGHPHLLDLGVVNNRIEPNKTLIHSFQDDSSPLYIIEISSLDSDPQFPILVDAQQITNQCWESGA